MKRLHLMVLKSYLGPFVLTFCISLFVLLMQFIWKYIDDLAGKGLEWYVLLELIGYTSMSLVPMALPLAILLSSIMTFGNLAESFELVAAKSSGISLMKMMQPLILASVFVSAMAFFFSNYMLPVSNLKMRGLLLDIQRQKPAIDLQPGIFYSGIRGYIIRIESKSNDGNTLNSIMIYDHFEKYDGNARVTLAKTGNISYTDNERYLVFHLINGVNYEEQNAFNKSGQGLPLVRNYFSEQYLYVDLSDFKLNRGSEDLFKDHYQMMTLAQLKKSLDEFKNDREKRLKDASKSIQNGYFFSDFKRENAVLGYGIGYSEPVNPSELMMGRNVFNKGLEKIPEAENETFEPIVEEAKEKVGGKIRKEDIEEKKMFQNLQDYQQTQLIDIAINLSRSHKVRTEDILQEMKQRKTNEARYWVEWHRKFTLSIACFLLFFIGAPLGAIIKKGGLGMPLVASIVIFIIYYVISTISEKSVKQLVMDPFTGMWLSSMILLPFGILLTIKANKDSNLFETEFYKKVFLKLKKMFNKKL
jgi:lipopolysaccharide export system permease protein